MSRDVLEQDLDVAGFALTGLRTATLPSDAVRLDQLAIYTFADGLTKDTLGYTVRGDYITGKAGGQVWLGGTAANDNLTIKATSNAGPTGTLGLVAAHTTWTVDQTVASASGATLDALKVAAPTITLSGSNNIATATGFNLVSLPIATISAASPITVTNAATLSIAGPPTYVSNAFLTNRHAIWVQTGGIRLSGRDDNGRAIWLDQAGEQDIIKKGGLFAIGTEDNNSLFFSTNNQGRFVVTGGGTIIFSNFNSLASVAGNGVVYRLNETVTSATTATLDNILYDVSTITISGSIPITTAAGLNNTTFAAPVYNGTPNITRAATVAIMGAPSGTAPVTSRYALDVQAGTTNLAGTTVIQALSGILKGTSGVVGTATVGVDYEGALTFSTGLTRLVNTITVDLSTGLGSAQTVTGATTTGGTLTLRGTSHATPGRTLVGSWFAFDEVNARVLIGTQTAGVGAPLTINSVDGGGNLRAVHLTMTGEQDIAKTGGLFGIGTTDNNTLAIYSSNTSRISIAGSGNTITTNKASLGSLLSGNGAIWRFDQTVTTATSATLDNFLFDASTITLNTAGTVTTSTGFNQFTIMAPTYTSTSAVTIQKAATVSISGAPIGAGAGGVTITTPSALWLQDGLLQISGADSSVRAILMNRAGEQDVIKSGGTFGLGTSDANVLGLLSGNTLRISLNGTGNVIASNRTSIGSLTTGNAFVFRYDASVTTATSATLDTFLFDAATVTLTSAGTITTATGFNYATFKAPTYTSGSAVLINKAATVAISGPPIGAGAGGVTFTTPSALWLQNGVLEISGVDASNRAIYLDRSGEQDVIKTGGTLVIGTNDGNTFGLYTNNVQRIQIDSAGNTIYSNKSSLGTITAGNGAVFRYDQIVTAAAGATLDNILFDQTTISFLSTATITTATGFNYATFRYPTYISAAAVTVQKAATVAISGPPSQAGSTTITNPYALWLQNGVLAISGVDASARAIWLDRAGEQDIMKSGGLLVVGTSDANGLSLDTNNQQRVSINSSGQAIHANRAIGSVTTGNGFVHRYDAAVTTATSATLDTILFDTSTVTLSTAGTITTAAGFNWATFAAPTYTSTSAVTVNKAATVAISGPPIAGGSVTLPNISALWLQAGSLTISGTDTSARAIVFDKSGEQDVMKSGGNFVIGTSDANGLYLDTGNQIRVAINGSGNVIASNKASIGSLATGNGFVTRYDASFAAGSSVTLNAILIDTATVTLTGGGTVSTATGFNYMTIKAPVYSGGGTGVTINNAATLFIESSPGATSGASIVNGYGIWSQGLCRLDAGLTVGGLMAGTNNIFSVSATASGDTATFVLQSKTITTTATTSYLDILFGGAAVADALVNAGPWAGVNISAPSFSRAGGGTTPTVTEASTLRISNEPQFSGAFTVAKRYAFHLSGGVARFDGGSLVGDSTVVFEVPYVATPPGLSTTPYAVIPIKVTGLSGIQFIPLLNNG